MTCTRSYNDTMTSCVNWMENNGLEGDFMRETNMLGVAFCGKSSPHSMFKSENDEYLFSYESDLLEPVPIASDLCQRVDCVTSLPSDLIENSLDYCVALQPLTKLLETVPGDSLDQTEVQFCSDLNISLGGGIHRSPSLVSLESLSGTLPSKEMKETVHLYDYQQERWVDRFQELVGFYSTRGHSNVPNNYGRNLACWVRRQRHQFKRAKLGRRSTLTSARVQLLELVGFTHDFHDLAWNTNFNRLVEFYKVHKHCNVPASPYGDPNGSLFNWCKRQKRACRVYLENSDDIGTRMNAQRLRLLQSIGFRFDPVRKFQSAP